MGNWLEQPVNMRRSESGVWETTVDLEAGAYLYRFLVDGEWQGDPACKVQEPDPYGGHDSVREVF